jgi:hypothetical protein
MSHVASVDCFVTSLVDARAAGAVCGLVLMEHQTSYASYSKADAGRCDHALRLVDHKADGYDHDYELWYDDFYTAGARLEAAAGKGLGTLKDEIAVAAARRSLEADGYRVSRSIVDGEIQLEATR